MITIVLLLTTATGFIHAQSMLYQCSMWGDPQLIQFPKSTLLSAQHNFCSFDDHAVLYHANTSGMCMQGCLSRSVQSQAMKRTARSSPGFIDAVRQGCISDVTLTGDSRAEVEIEKLVASATWPCKPHVPVCIMPALIRRRLASVFG
ncbi:hypothetical protein I4U23_016013 [Adineta vaga]|nr:hypothetical protein I4U23_016013 [Adineta vaga]